MKPDPAEHAHVLAVTYGLENARWITAENAEHAHDDRTRHYWLEARRALGEETTCTTAEES